MKKVLSLAVLLSATAAMAADLAPNGIALPEGYRDWQVIAMAHRTDNSTVRVIVGNDVAIEAARAGNVDPWPDGAILGKLVWSERVDDNWESAIVPGEFRLAEFMIKDSAAYPDTGGWGFARWLGLDQRPFGQDATFVEGCFGCHTPVADRDYVFTTPVVLPAP